MSLPYFRLYPADYEADTAHLTTEEDGAYSRLLRLCWRSPGCCLPDDMDWIRRRVRASQEEFDRAYIPVLSEFFERENRTVFSPRLKREYEHSHERHQKARENGKKGGRPKTALKTNEKTKTKRLADENQTVSEKKANQNQNQRYKKESVNTLKKRTAFPPDATLSEGQLSIALEQGVSEAEAHAQFERWRDYCLANDKKYVNWDSAWRNWFRSPYFKPVLRNLKDVASGTEFDKAHSEYTRRLAAGEIQRRPDPSNPFPTGD